MGEVIDFQARATEALVESLLEESRLEEGERLYQQFVFNLNSVIRVIEDMLKSTPNLKTVDDDRGQSLLRKFAQFSVELHQQVLGEFQKLVNQ